MHLLAAINNNVEEWRALQKFDRSKPRLPLPYVFGGAFLKAGHLLSALDVCSQASRTDMAPFKALYYKQDLREALGKVDLAALWGSEALKAIFQQAIMPGRRRNILYFTYVFAPDKPSVKQRCYDLALLLLAGATSGLVLMTGDQTRKAQSLLEGKTPVIRMRCGIDTAFYRGECSFGDVPEHERARVEMLLGEPYVVMPGDELRFNDDAIRFVEKSGVRLVRISQYGYKSGTDKLRRNVAERGLDERLLVFEKIDYAFLRFLLRHASAYAGLVDSSWQPAGWTVACEALSSGLPMVMYDGLVSREMEETGVPAHLVQSVAMGEIDGFAEKLAALAMSKTRKLSEEASAFAASHLDFGKTAPLFVAEVEKLVTA